MADLTGSTVAELADPLESLTDAGIVTLGMWRAHPAHPLVAEAILTPLTPSERSDLHKQAASYLAKLDRPLQVVAGHLVHTLPDEDHAVVELLRAAGEESLRNGTPAVAASQLRRAVGETRPESTDAALLALAASAHVLAGERAEAFDLWERALDRADGAEERARYLADMGDAGMTMGGRQEAAHYYRRAMDALAGEGHDTSSPALRRLLVRMGMARALYDGVEAEIVHAVTDAAAQPPDRDTHPGRLLFALAASSLGMRGEDHHRARELAVRALGNGALLAEEGCEGIGFYVASAALSWADAYEENLEELGAAIAESRRRGSVVGLPRRRTAPGSPATARATCTGPSGAVSAAHGEHEAALADYRRAAALMGDRCDNASLVEWRELSVWSLLALGRSDEACELAAHAVEHARRWGAPRSLGFALRTWARVAPRDEAVVSLREAVVLAEEAGLVDCRARAWVDLARHLVPGGESEHAEGVHLLRSAFDYARKADVTPVLRQATRGLLLAGERVEEPAAGRHGLTPGERRVVELAAAGETNRRIAQQLFVTVKAVAWHLSNAYRKLAISSRAELRDALYGEPGANSSDR